MSASRLMAPAQGNGALPERARVLIDTWFGPPGDPDRENHRDIWFKWTPAYDDMLRQLFLADYERAAAGALSSWEKTAEGALALLLLLDQLPRNIFRDTPRAYDTDPAARAAADRAVARGFDAAVPPAWRIFFYLPFHHSEDLADQRRATALSAALRAERDPDPEGGANRRYGRPYPEVIERFGRFPHRNAILGRQSTPEEAAFLDECNRLRRPPASPT
jgi:uncharacterized protein (DUF924 family)